MHVLFQKKKDVGYILFYRRGKWKNSYFDINGKTTVLNSGRVVNELNN